MFATDQTPHEDTFTEKKINLTAYFNVKDIKVKDAKHQGKIIKLDDRHLSASLEYLFKCASKELVASKDKKFLVKHTFEKDGIHYCKTHLEETAKLSSQTSFRFHQH